MQLIEDTRNKVGKHKELNDYLEAKGHKVFRSKLLVGDYSLTTNQSVCIDTKADLLELCTNVCGKEEHERFRGECLRAKEAGIRLVVLCENGKGVRELEDVRGWQNPRLRFSPKALNGNRLYRILATMQQKYDVEFLFCDKSETGEKIIELLG